MRNLLLFILLGFGMPFSGSSTTIVPFKNLAKLYLASDEVILAQAGETIDTLTNDCTHHDCGFKVLLALKGVLPNDTTISLRQYSYFDQWGYFDIVGDFIPEEDHYYLIFLDWSGNSWRPMMLSYYVFEQVWLGGDNGDYFLQPVEASLNIGVFPNPDGEIAEPLATYKRDPLLKLLLQYNTDPGQPWNPATVMQTPANSQTAAERAIPAGCDFDTGAGISRWKNPLIHMYYDVTNAPSDAAARFEDVLDILNTEYPGLDLINNSTADFTPDCSDGSVSGNDFITFSNNILSGNQSVFLMFEDPCNQMVNLVNCSGVLGLGGGYMLSTTHLFKGDTWKDAAWGYVVINNGARECLSQLNYERLLSHELTHSFKMDHLDPVLFPNNNMNPLCCNAINDKDRECMNYVYSAALPVELISFEVLEKEKVIDIRWATAQERNNDYFIVEKSADGLRFESLAEVDASASSQAASYTIQDLQPFPGQNYYRLVQQDLDGTRTYLGIRAVHFNGVPVRYVIAPNPVHDDGFLLIAGGGALNIESLELLDANGRVTQWRWNSTQSAPNQMELGMSNLPAGVYWLNINEGQRSEKVKIVKQ